MCIAQHVDVYQGLTEVLFGASYFHRDKTMCDQHQNEVKWFAC